MAMGWRTLFREKTVGQLQDLVTGGESVVLYGKPGVGKQSIMEEAYRRSGWEVVTVDVVELSVKCMNTDEIHAVVKELVERASEKGALLYMPRIEQLKVIEDRAGASTTGLAPIFSELCARVGRGQVQCVATTTAYHSMLRRISAFFARFQPLNVEAMDSTLAAEALCANSVLLSRAFGKRVHHDAIRYAVRLTDKYFPRQEQPSKTIEFLEEVCTAEDKCTVGAVLRQMAELTSLDAEKLFNTLFNNVTGPRSRAGKMAFKTARMSSTFPPNPLPPLSTNGTFHRVASSPTPALESFPLV